jgi:hypothetical protein
MTEIVQKNVCGSYKEADEWEGCSIDDFVIPNGEVFTVSDEEMRRMNEELSHICERIDRDAAIAEIESRNIVLTD